MIKHIENENQFNQEISKGLTIVDFFATWCGPCRMLAPIIEEIADEYDGKVTVVKIDVDGDGRELAYKFGISSIPTVMFFKDGSEYTREIGYMPKEHYTAILEDMQ